MDKILKICKKHKILIIEDAAEVLGLSYKNKKCGSFGDISTFSFYANKQITTGEGGMISTNSEK
jgi:perosamine synthetase